MKRIKLLLLVYLIAAKMNRGTTIRIPEPNSDDIKNLSETIAKSYLGENLEENIKIFFKNLGWSYYKYKEEFKKDNNLKEYEDFHGNRDLYHLIKYSAVKIKEKLIKDKNKNIDKNFLFNLAFISLERNFGGLEIDKEQKGFNIIKNKFLECYQENNIKNNSNIDVKNRIMDNLKEFYDDYLSRYLLLITKSNIGIYLLSYFLKSNFEKNNYNIFIGSVFKDDIKNEEYTSKILNKIKLNIEKEYILILKNLDSIYTSLYDLFNLNFVKIQNKKYARIALGSRTNASSEVNDKFRCIIIVDENKLNEQEIPFLNRFEKQSLSFQFLLNNDEISLINEIYEKCQNIVKYENKDYTLINYKINNLLINCDIEEINGIIYSNKININYDDLFANKLSRILPQDIILLLLMNKKEWEKKDKYKNFYNKILDDYDKNTFNNIKNFLNNYKTKDNENNNKIVIYTFTRIIENIKKSCLEAYGEIKEIRISSIKNENNLENEIEDFLSKEKYGLCIIKFLPFEYFIIDYLKNVVENKEIEFEDKCIIRKNKKFIFLVHLERELIDCNENLNSEENGNINSYKRKKLRGSLSNLANYTQVFIDDINAEDFFDNKKQIITINKIFKMENYDLYKAFINKETIFLDQIYYILYLLGYSFYNNEKNILDDLNKDKYIELIFN